MSDIMQPDIAAIETYAGVVFGGLDGTVAIRVFPESTDARGNGKQLTRIPFLHTGPDLAKEIFSHAELAARDKLALYVIPATTRGHGLAKGEDVCSIITILADLDDGDIKAKLEHLTRFLGAPTMTVASGGITSEGATKAHLYWKLTCPAEGEALALAVRLRHAIAIKTGCDLAFQKPAQPVRVAGTWHFKGDERLVKILECQPSLEYDLNSLANLVGAMPALEGLVTADGVAGAKRPLSEIYGVPIHEGGADGTTRFEVMTQVIGRWVGHARDGLVTHQEALEVVHNYNQHNLKPPWGAARVEKEFSSIVSLDKKKSAHGVAGGVEKIGNVLRFSKPGLAGIDAAINEGLNTEIPSDGRPAIRITGDLDADLSNCERALIESGAVEVYQRGGAMVRRGTARGKSFDGSDITYDNITQYDQYSLRADIAKAMLFQGYDKRENKWVPRHPPKDYAQALLARSKKDYPILQGLISSPIMRRDGTILARPGYDAATGLYFDPKGVNFPAVDANPSLSDAIAAIHVLMKPLREFPFGLVGCSEISKNAYRSVQLARMLTGVARTAVMFSPMFIYTAPAPRTGKSKLVDIAVAMSHGHRAHVTPTTSTATELDKHMLAKIAGGATVLAIDNQKSNDTLESPLLSQLLTQQTIDIRDFGQIKNTQTYPNGITVSANGNNISVADDLTTRSLLCALDADMESPGDREFAFDAVDEALETRGELVNAALTVLGAYVMAGSPAQHGKQMGGFEGWLKLIRNALMWAGQEDPCLTMQNVRDTDQGRMTHATILELWSSDKRFRGVATSPGEAIENAQKNAIEPGGSALLDAFESIADKSTKNLAMALGRWLPRKCGVIINKKRFVACKGQYGRPEYMVEEVEEPTKKGLKI